MKKLCFCGGGSAGHVIPNLCIAEELKGKYDICYLGTGGIEKQLCRERGIDFYEFDGVKLVREKPLCNIALPVKLFKSITKCRRILEKLQPDLLFCKGGYASLPPAFAAAKLGIPVLTHESDLTPGLANKLIAHKAERVLTSFKETEKRFKNGAYTGAPMRASLWGRDKAEAKRRFGFDMRPTVLVFGGGSGSRIINQNLREIIMKLCRKFNVLHICGEGNKINCSVYGYVQQEFCSDMGLAYACCDYAVARCGSNSAFELIALKIPTLFIPLENGASRGDQVANAEYFLSQGLCRVLREGKLTPQSLYDGIEELIGDDKIKAALHKNDSACGNKNIIEQIERYC